MSATRLFVRQSCLYRRDNISLLFLAGEFYQIEDPSIAEFLVQAGSAETEEQNAARQAAEAEAQSSVAQGGKTVAAAAPFIPASAGRTFAAHNVGADPAPFEIVSRSPFPVSREEAAREEPETGNREPDTALRTSAPAVIEEEK